MFCVIRCFSKMTEAVLLLVPPPHPSSNVPRQYASIWPDRGALMSQKSGWLIYANLVAVLNQSPVLQVFPYNSISKRGNIFCANGGNVCLAARTLQILDILRLCSSLLFWGTLSIFLLAITKVFTANWVQVRPPKQFHCVIRQRT